MDHPGCGMASYVEKFGCANPSELVHEGLGVGY